MSRPKLLATVIVALLLTIACSALTAHAAPWIRTAKSGAWSEAETWEGNKVPATGDRVHVRAGHAVVYDVVSEQTLRAVYVAGKLSFAPDKNTRLDVGVLKIEPGTDPSEEGFDCDAHVMELPAGAVRPVLEVGMPNAPIRAEFTARIRLVPCEGQDKQSCPAIVCCGGRMDFHGAPLSRTWVKLGETAAKGATTVTLAEAVTGWRVGDQIIITGTNPGYNKDGITDQRTITAIEGKTIQFAEPLADSHLGDGEYRAEVANLSRNVIVESAEPAGERGHTMYHKGSAGSISYAEFRHLGKKNVLGRYSLHFHLVGNTMRGSSVVGASIWDSHNRWLTIHGTNYLVVRDCVGFGSVGHGYFLEDGTEIYNVLDRNLAVEAKQGKKLPKQVLPFDQNDGAGFWWANSLNTFTRNVAAGNHQYGFRYEATPTSALKLDLPVMQPDGKYEKVDIRTLPFVRFDDNEVHTSHGLYGINLGEGVNRVGPDVHHPFVVRNTKIWNVHYGFRPQVPSLLVENMTIESHYGVYHPNFDHHVYRNVTIRRTDTEPFNRGHDDLSVQYGPVTVDGLTLEGIRSGGMPLIQISDDNPTGRAVSHFRNVNVANWNDNSKQKAIVNLGGGPRPQPTTPQGVPIYLHDWFGPGRTAEVVSTRSPEFKANPDKYRAEPPLTGDESRVAEVSGIEFPTLLTPVDDLPPQTVITHVVPAHKGWLVVGTTADNGEVKQVLVNGLAAKATRNNFAEWEIFVPNVVQSSEKMTFTAAAIDAIGNQERLPHVVTLGE